MDILNLILEQWQQQSWVEVVAVFLAIAYVWLAAHENIWCWPAGFISTSLFAYVYWDVTLIFQMLLNLYYMGMAIFGFFTWRKKGDDQIKISNMPFYLHIIIVLLGFVISAITYWVAIFWLSYDLVLLDIGVTVFSLLTTYLTVRKYIESWYYWSVINLATIFLVWPSTLYLTAFLMVIYIGIALKGLLNWKADYKLRMNEQK